MKRTHVTLPKHFELLAISASLSVVLFVLVVGHFAQPANLKLEAYSKFGSTSRVQETASVSGAFLGAQLYPVQSGPSMTKERFTTPEKLSPTGPALGVGI